jgi:hypothetical protein
MSAATKEGKALKTPTVMIAQQDGEYILSYMKAHSPHRSGLMMLVHHWDAWERYHMHSHHHFRCLAQHSFRPTPAPRSFPTDVLRTTGAPADEFWCSEKHRSSGGCFAVVVTSPRWYYQRMHQRMQHSTTQAKGGAPYRTPYTMKGPFPHIEAFREVHSRCFFHPDHV